LSQQIATISTVSRSPKQYHLAIAVVAVIAIGIFAMVWLLTLSYVSASAVSPDGTLRAEIVDRSFQFIDRNFRVRIVDGKGIARTVFRSPDESPSGVGQEQLLWSADGNRLLLVGKFWVREGAELANGKCLYLLYDIPSGQVWCNSDQRVGSGFDREQLEGFDLTSLTP
jgi:hypothetical protein